MKNRITYLARAGWPVPARMRLETLCGSENDLAAAQGE